jgi:hypothetical protein
VIWVMGGVTIAPSRMSAFAAEIFGLDICIQKENSMTERAAVPPQMTAVSSGAIATGWPNDLRGLAIGVAVVLYFVVPAMKTVGLGQAQHEQVKLYHSQVPRDVRHRLAPHLYAEKPRLPGRRLIHDVTVEQIHTLSRKRKCHELDARD